MLLSDIELRSEVAAGRLIFDPPLPAIAFQSASIDLGLHEVFWRPRVPRGEGLEFVVDVGRLSESRRTLSGGPPASSAPVGSVRGVNQVREDRRNRHEEGIRLEGRHDC